MVENFSDLEFMEDDEIIDEAQDTLTILSKYVESLNSIGLEQFIQ